MPTIKFPSAAGALEIEVNLGDFASVMDRLALHGLQQKVADSVANAKTKGWSMAECKEKCYGVLDALRAGDWGRSRVVTFSDFMRKTIIDMAKAQDKKAGKTDTAEGYAKRADAAMVRAAEEPDSPIGRLVAAKRAEYDAMQAAPEADLEI